jgi:hypothetical protein
LSPRSPGRLKLARQLGVVRSFCRATPIEEKIEQLSDFVPMLQGVPHHAAGLDDVLVASTDALALDESRLDEVGDDSLCRPLRDPGQPGDVTDPDLGVASEAEKNLGVARDEAPRFLILIA